MQICGTDQGADRFMERSAEYVTVQQQSQLLTPLHRKHTHTHRHIITESHLQADTISV